MPAPSYNESAVLADTISPHYPRDFETYRFTLMESRIMYTGRHTIDINFRLPQEFIGDLDDLVEKFNRQSPTKFARHHLCRAAVMLFMRIARETFTETRNDEAEAAAQVLLTDIKALHPATAAKLRQKLYGGI
jgi:hypothetical protein